MSQSDFLRELGPLALALRLKRLADQFMEDGRKIYTKGETGLEPNWYVHLLLLHRRGPQSVTQMAQALGQKHPSVVEATRKLERAGLIESHSNPKDKRIRCWALSQLARQRMPQFQRIWDAFDESLSNLLGASNPLLSSLQVLEEAVVQQSLEERVHQQLKNVEPATAKPKKLRTRANPVIRPISMADREPILTIAQGLVRRADTYAFDPGVSDDDLWHYWAPVKPGRGYVAVHENQVVAMFVIRPNHPGPGAHIANASYAVKTEARGLGLGRFIGEASLEIAKDLGYRGLQFNIVISTNQAALKLWFSLGFRIIGTVPEGFRHKDGQWVDHHIMYRSLG